MVNIKEKRWPKSVMHLFIKEMVWKTRLHKQMKGATEITSTQRVNHSSDTRKHLPGHTVRSHYSHFLLNNHLSRHTLLILPTEQSSLRTYTTHNSYSTEQSSARTYTTHTSY